MRNNNNKYVVLYSTIHIIQKCGDSEQFDLSPIKNHNRGQRRKKCTRATTIKTGAIKQFDTMTTITNLYNTINLSAIIPRDYPSHNIHIILLYYLVRKTNYSQ